MTILKMNKINILVYISVKVFTTYELTVQTWSQGRNYGKFQIEGVSSPGVNQKFPTTSNKKKMNITFESLPTGLA